MIDRTTLGQGRTRVGQAPSPCCRLTGQTRTTPLRGVQMSGSAGAPIPIFDLERSPPSLWIAGAVQGRTRLWLGAETDSPSLLNVPAKQETRRGQSDGPRSAQRRLAGAASGGGFEAFPGRPIGAHNLTPTQAASITLIVLAVENPVRATTRPFDGAHIDPISGTGGPFGGRYQCGGKGPRYFARCKISETHSEVQHDCARPQ